jgi:hypothetical protein
MAKFMLVYLGGNQPSNPEEGKKHFEEYRNWLVSLGDSIVSAANPLNNTHVIHPDGKIEEGSATAMSGFSILEAETIEAAVEMAKACPFKNIGGTLEVSELVEMNMDTRH